MPNNLSLSKAEINLISSIRKCCSFKRKWCDEKHVEIVDINKLWSARLTVVLKITDYNTSSRYNEVDVIEKLLNFYRNFNSINLV